MDDDRLLEAYPLTWPEAQARTPPVRRKSGRFEAGFAQSRDELLDELGRLGGINIIVSSSVPLRRDGLPLADAREPSDPGVAVYFERADGRGNHRPYVLACDTYLKVKHNLRAIGATVEALRAIERHGGSRLLEQAFTGFTALAAHAAEPSWWDVLGVAPDAPLEQIKARRAALALEHHPDVGGDGERMARINRAYDAAMQERG